MISLRGVTKSFRDAGREMPVLRGVDLHVGPGEMVAILGASGSGKSTLLYVVGALDHDFGGDVVVAERDLRRLGPSERADLRNRSIGFVFQSFNLLPGLTALENAMLPGILRRGPGAPSVAQARAGALDALARVGLSGAAGARPARLSGGERQRVAVARALAAGPRVMLADEPTGNLDAATGEDVIRLFARLAGEGLAVLVVTHEERVSRAASRVLELRDGRLA